MCQFHPIHGFIHFCHMVIILIDYIVHLSQGQGFDSITCKSEGLGSLIDTKTLLSILWLSYCALVFVCLKQLLNYILQMIKHLVECIIVKAMFISRFFICRWSGGENILNQKAQYEYMYTFSSVSIVHIHMLSS